MDVRAVGGKVRGVGGKMDGCESRWRESGWV